MTLILDLHYVKIKNYFEQNMSKFFFSLHSIASRYNYPGGSLNNVTSEHTTGLENISLYSLNLRKKGHLRLYGIQCS